MKHFYCHWHLLLQMKHCLKSVHGVSCLVVSLTCRCILRSCDIQIDLFEIIMSLLNVMVGTSEQRLQILTIFSFWGSCVVVGSANLGSECRRFDSPPALCVLVS